MGKNKKPNKQQPPPLRLLLYSRNNRVMTQLRDSLLSQLTELHPTLPPSVLTRRSSFIQSRLQNLFHSFHTPTHPPYALMINRAIVELNDQNGSTEEAISGFVRREYEDLPWAHSKILSVHLKRLCQVGELACNEDGRYVFPGGEEEKEGGKGSKKRKRGDRRSNRMAMLDSSVGTDEASTEVSESDQHSIGSVEKEIQCLEEPNEELEQDSQTQVSESDHHSIGSVEEQIQVQSEKEVQCLEPKELEESQTQMVSNRICAEGSPECMISAGPGIELSSPTQLQPQISADINTDVTAALISVNVDDDELPQDYNQGNTNGNLDENPISECLELIQPKRKRGRPCKSETDANCQEDSSLLKQGPKRNKKKQEGLTRSRGPRGRPRKVIQDTEQCEEKLKEKEEKLKKKEDKLKKKEEKLKKKDQGKLCRREEKLKKKDQAQLCDREEKSNTKYQAKLRDREEKLNKKDQAKLRGQGRGRGRGRGRGQGRHPKPKVCDTIEVAPPAEATAM
ncbi:glutamic acid-rich protein-like isoform X1 [Trifolium pratense]|uniref:glutamic acid-rich protein-like isoform X1 n=1 Tax=Trifolium pratense TaxID=57577 RepID=UPI001E6900D4|nr:glutamic acid-rich protein-like isoform X1 [Trifolium pratense]